MTEGRNEIWATCGHCSHTFVIYAPLPAPVEVVCRAMKNARCPNCKRTKQKLLMATEANILAALSQNAVGPPSDGGAGEPASPNPPSSPAPTSSHQENS